jgi:hypothetical protein
MLKTHMFVVAWCRHNLVLVALRIGVSFATRVVVAAFEMGETLVVIESDSIDGS